jgi:hypothetical protein
VEIGVWLRELGLERYEEAFQAGAIDPEVLVDLTDTDLRELGIPLGPRRKLLKAISVLVARTERAMSELASQRYATFVTTGHDALKALLIVSGGASVMFMAFFGAFFGDQLSSDSSMPGALRDMANVTMYFLVAVTLCMIAYGTTFLSHFAYYEDRTKIGKIMMIISGILGLACLGCVITACVKVIGGINSLLGGVA